jgi:hypothetical protein
MIAGVRSSNGASLAKSTAAGTPGDFTVASHLVVRGTQAEMGFALARAAIDAYGSTPRPAAPVLGRARQRWFAANWPEHHERSRGMI